MTDKHYCYPPDYTVLKNRLNLRTKRELDFFEREFVTQRIAEGIPDGNFDLAHLKAIHCHLFQDVYEWAGEVRTVEISKGDHQFQFRRYIETGMADIHRRIEKQNYLRNLSVHDFTERAAEIIGDINYVHPFREGNGRVQLQYLKLFAEQAGHTIDLTCLEKTAWLEASKQAHQGNYSPMSQCLIEALEPEQLLDSDEREL